MQSPLWDRCVAQLETEFSALEITTWIRPLEVDIDQGGMRLIAPNQFVQDNVQQIFYNRILAIAQDVSRQEISMVSIETDARQMHNHSSQISNGEDASKYLGESKKNATNLNPIFTFDSFVTGKDNNFSHANAMKVSKKPGLTDHNPFCIYGGVGLGKTHLMHAIGNQLVAKSKNTKLCYLHAEEFVSRMVRSLQHNKINQFKDFYRSLDILLIDDVQFLAGKERSQEEFFHTFNTLVESGRQVVLACDRYPNEIEGLSTRLKSRFGWGLTTFIDLPDLETRMAILHKKALNKGVALPEDVAFFIANRVRSNVRALEGALHRVIAHTHFHKQAINIELTREALRDLISIQDQKISIQNIQKTVASYYKIRIQDLLSKRRNRAITRPRQIAMALTKESTRHSLPEIGDAFGGRDHTTVIHACRKVEELRQKDPLIDEDYKNLYRILSN